MLRRAIPNTSIRGAIAALHVVAVLAPAAAQAAETGDVAAPIVPSPGAQAPGGGGLRIADAVQLALSSNERARISDLNVVVADAAVEKARTGFLPVLTFNGNDTGTAAVVARAAPPRRPGEHRPQPAAPQRVGLSRSTRRPRRSPRRSARRTSTTSCVLAFNAATAFFSVLSASAVVDAAQRALENAQANLADTQARAEAQLTSTNDVTRAQVDLAGASRELEADKGTLDNAYVQLAFLLNAPVSGPLATPDADARGRRRRPGSARQPRASSRSTAGPTFVVDKEAVAAAHDFADEPLLRIIPTLGLQGTASGTSNAPVAIKQWNHESLAATLTWTLYDAGARYADKHSRDAQADDRRAEPTAARAQRRRPGPRAPSRSSRPRRPSSRRAGDARDAARQNVDETAILYRQGLAKAIELVDANDTRFTAEVNYAGAQYAMAEAYLNLRQAMGLDPLGTELK